MRWRSSNEAAAAARVESFLPAFRGGVDGGAARFRRRRAAGGRQEGDELVARALREAATPAGGPRRREPAANGARTEPRSSGISRWGERDPDDRLDFPLRLR